jgi:hypothetical protein
MMTFIKRRIYMSTFTRLIREGKIGRWCKRGAFFIAALGILQVLAMVCGIWLEYHQTAPYGPPSIDSSLLLFGASQIFWVIGYTIFFSLMLYAIGAVVDSFSRPAKSDITYESLDKEDRSVDEQTVHTGI